MATPESELFLLLAEKGCRTSANAICDTAAGILSSSPRAADAGADPGAPSSHVAHAASEPEPQQASDALCKLLASLFVALFGIKSRYQLGASGITSLRALRDLARKHVKRVAVGPGAAGDRKRRKKRGGHGGERASPWMVCVSERLCTATVALPAVIPSLAVNVMHLVTWVWTSIDQLLDASHQVGLRRHAAFGSLLASVDATLPKVAWHKGTIHAAERGDQTFVYKGSFGFIQVGIPAESIKTYMAKGAEVPQVYVLMPQVSKSDVNLSAEVEFPIYFQFFLKAASRDPNRRVIVIGSKEQIEQVQTSFQESVFGPVAEHVYFDRELSEDRRRAGYWVDFAKEREWLAFKKENGEAPSLDDFAKFLAFDDTGSVSFVMKKKPQSVEEKKPKKHKQKQQTHTSSTTTTTTSSSASASPTSATMASTTTTTTAAAPSASAATATPLGGGGDGDKTTTTTTIVTTTTTTTTTTPPSASPSTSTKGKSEVDDQQQGEQRDDADDADADDDADDDDDGNDDDCEEEEGTTSTNGKDDADKVKGDAVDEEGEDVVVSVTLEQECLLRFKENGKTKALLDASLPRTDSTDMPVFQGIDNIPPSALGWEPPVLGVSFIGTSHGFDPLGTCTGFIIWVNGNGILVDPPVQTVSFLAAYGISNRFVKAVILTHCHSDHDSGLITQILAGRKIRLYTTETINASYKRKVNALTGLTDVGEYYEFCPVPIGGNVSINGALFEFDYSFHTIPTIRFKLQYQGRSISYSSDTYYSPTALRSLVEKGVMNEQRELALRSFLFDADMIIHEAGIPPIHTSLLDLNDLPKSIKKKLYIVHCTKIPDVLGQRTLRDGTVVDVYPVDLHIPPIGIENTVVLDVGDFFEGYSKCCRHVSMLADIPFFQTLTSREILHVFSTATEIEVEADKVIVTPEKPSEAFYLIVRGQCDVYIEKRREKRVVTTLMRGDHFGEAALRSSKTAKRTAFVRTVTPCRLLCLRRDLLAPILSHDIERAVSRITRFRPFLLESLGRSILFRNLKRTQLASVASVIQEPQAFDEGEVIFRQGDTNCSLWLIQEGEVRLEKRTNDGESEQSFEFMRLHRGDAFGEMALLTKLPRTATAVANTPCMLLELTPQAFESLMEQHQNIRYHLSMVVEQRMKETAVLDTSMRRLTDPDVAEQLAMFKEARQYAHEQVGGRAAWGTGSRRKSKQRKDAMLEQIGLLAATQSKRSFMVHQQPQDPIQLRMPRVDEEDGEEEGEGGDEAPATAPGEAQTE